MSIEERIDGYYKSEREIAEFLREMVRQGELQAYGFIMNEQLIDKETEDEQIIKVIKGTNLKPIGEEQMVYWDDFFLKEPTAETLYYVTLTSDYDYNNRSPFGHLKITRLAKDSDLRKIKEGYTEIMIPKDMIDGLLSYDWRGVKRTNSKGDYNEISANLSIDKEDDFFAKVAEFVRNKRGQHNG
jgi:hypothetical protein